MTERDPGEAYARRIERADDLIPGPLAAGTIGDWIIGNDRIRVVITEVDRSLGFARSGGNIIDAAPTGEGQDLLQMIFSYLDDQFPRQADYEKIRVVSPGGGKKEASLLAEGIDTHDPANRITTVYSVGPDDSYIKITTTIDRALETGDLEAYELGDAIQWGGSDHFAPGLGIDLPYVIESAWIAGIAPESSYGYVGEAGPIRVKSGRAWSDPIIKTVDLKAGEHASYTRYLVVGSGDTASIVRAAATIRGMAIEMLRGRVTEEDGETPIAGAWVEVFGEAEEPLYFAMTDKGGRFEMPRTQGALSARARSRSRRASDRAPLAETLEFRLGPEGMVRYTIRDDTGDPGPGRITLEGMEGTPDPDLGPATRAAGARNLSMTLSGEGEVRLPPGRYRISASRGPEHSIDSRVIEVVGGEPASLDFQIRRVIDTAGYLACDFHQHAANSSDSGVSNEDRVISNVAEGLELMVSTDHDYLTNFAPVIRRLGVGDRIQSMVGDEVTAPGLGHFNAYPLHLDSSSPRGGALDPWGRSPDDLFAALRAVAPAEKVIQINHPRSGSSGYFQLSRLNSEEGWAEEQGFSWNFDAIEVMNGTRFANFERVLEDWFHLLNRGRAYVATGNSDTHDIFAGRPGYPRNYVRVDEDDPRKVTPEMIVRALKTERNVIVSNGPFIVMEGPEGTPIGSVVTYPKGDVPITVRIQAAEWILLDRLEIVCNGVVRHRVRFDQGLPGEIQFSVPLEGDGWIVAVLRGEKPMMPVLPAPAVAFTNPIWIDRGGDGFDPPVPPR